MKVLLAVFLGGGLGACLRYFVTLWGARVTGGSFPLGTLSVNVLGSLIMGFLSFYLIKKLNADELTRLFLMTGLLGGFTTFSAFSLDFLTLYERGAYSTAALYGGLSILVSLGAVFVGVILARML